VDLTWGIVGLVIGFGFLVWLYINTVRGHSRMASDVTIKPSQRDRYDAKNPDRPRRMGEQVRDTKTAPKKR